MQTVEALAQLGQVCQVLMLVQNPCQYYWGDIVAGHDQLRARLRPADVRLSELLDPDRPVRYAFDGQQCGADCGSHVPSTGQE